MIDDSGGLCLNIAKVPVVKKKAKKNTDVTVTPKSAQQKNKEIHQKPTQPKVPTAPASGGFTKILKKPVTVSSNSIWKKFKQAYKGDGKFGGAKHKTPVKKEMTASEIKPVFVKKSVTFQKDPTEPITRQSVDDETNLKSKRTKFKFSDDGDVPKHKYFTSDDVKPEQSSSKRTTSLFWNNPEIPSVPHRAVRPVKETVFSDRSFEDLNLHPYMVKYLKESMGLTKMTTVQEKAIPVLLKKQDALVKSQTGSGKTLAYTLPILHDLQGLRPKINRADGVLALIIVPTRELALQTYEVFNKLVKSYTWIVPGYLVGGEKRKSEKARLRKGISILIGTPGRLIDHVQHTKALKLDKVSWLVIDEADRLFDMGYEKDVSVLLETLNSSSESPDKVDTANRQTVLLSATLTPKVEKLAGLSLKNPVFIDACDENVAAVNHVPVFGSDVGNEVDTMVLPENLAQRYLVTPPKLKLVTLVAFILWKSKLTKQKKMLIFFATQDMVDFYTQLLSSIFSTSKSDADYDSDDEDSSRFSNSGIELFKLHGNMKQNERTEVFKTFRKSYLGVLLCTDVAARGLDLPEVDWVIQYTGPTSVSDYVHRVGRTARGGQSGSSIIFLTPNEVGFIAKLENCQIRLQEEKMETCLKHLLSLTRGKSTVQEEATKLQLKFEDAVANSKLYDLACKAYASWSRFYASYPRNMRDAFSVKAVHQGHYAKSFALKDSPSAIVNYAKEKNLNVDRFARKRPREKKESDTGKRYYGRSRLAEVSEFDSGLEPLQKKKK